MFNQRLLAEHCLSEEDALAIWTALSDEDLKVSLGQINAQMAKVGLEIRGLSIGGRQHYAFVNTFPDDVAQAVLAMTQPEQAYIRAVLRALAEEGEATKASLLNAKDKAFALPQAEAALERLVEEKWIEWVDPRKRNKNGSKVQLAPRTYLELSYMLVDDFGMSKDDLPQMVYHMEE
jgi:Nse1 non-SMC component of SMC5-6 complex